MRVYECAKKFSIPNKTILEFLQQHGFTIATHMAVVPEQAMSLIEKEFGAKKAVAEETPVVQKASQKTLSAQTTPSVTSSIPPAEQQRTAPSPIPTEKVAKKEQSIAVSPKEEPKEIILEPMSVERVAGLTGKSVSELIMLLLRRGKMFAKNDILPEKVVADLATEFNIPVRQPAAAQEQAIQREVGKSKNAVKRSPVIVVMGHVDHGKTTLLDFIRKTRVATREKGGITQHVGAYEVDTKEGKLVFLDTPGHEAFSKMRARGAKVADIAVLVVAADDSIMPQTREAVAHARAMNIPIIVAINKIDKVDAARIERVRQDLAQLNLIAEEWGGQTIMVPISAKTGVGVDTLLEMIALQSELMELHTDTSLPAECYVIESRLEKGRGAVATVICHQGTLAAENFFTCGATVGKVGTLTDSFGKQIKQVLPSIPVVVSGFEALAEVGDLLRVVPEAEYRSLRSQKKGRVESVVRPIMITSQEGVNVIIKTDGNATREALVDALEKLGRKHGKHFVIVSTGIGTITENDVLMASHTGSCVVGLHVKAETNAVILAKNHHVTIKLFDIIYHLIEDLEKMVIQEQQVKTTLVVTGHAVVRKVFNIKDIGVIAGCYMQDGICSRTSRVRVYRGRHNQKVGEGNIKSLQRDKKAVKEIHAGFECALLIDGFQDWQVDDKIECITEKVVEAAS